MILQTLVLSHFQLYILFQKLQGAVPQCWFTDAMIENRGSQLELRAQDGSLSIITMPTAPSSRRLLRYMGLFIANLTSPLPSMDEDVLAVTVIHVSWSMPVDDRF